MLLTLQSVINQSRFALKYNGKVTYRFCRDVSKVIFLLSVTQMTVLLSISKTSNLKVVRLLTGLFVYIVA